MSVRKVIHHIGALLLLLGAARVVLGIPVPSEVGVSGAQAPSVPERTSFFEQLGVLQRLPLRPSLYIKCGGTSFIDESGTVWQSDRPLSKAATYGDSSGHRLVLVSQLYSSGRSSRKGPIEYHLPLPLGCYTLTLFFMELYQREVGKSVFSIEIEDVVAFDDIDIVQRVGNKRPLKLTKEIELYDGVLDIRLAAKRGTASLSAFSLSPAL